MENYDIISVGFGAAALSIAIALRDRGIKPRIVFLEKQPEFGWHTGMLLPGTKMQISYLKDLATQRDPTSHFTFLNYLHVKGRLVNFTNLSTHLPLREEFNDYLKWCASHFDDIVQYKQEVLSVTPNGSPAGSFTVKTRDVDTGAVKELVGKQIIVATGGEKAIPASLASQSLPEGVIHSSEFMNKVPQRFTNPHAEYRCAIIGGGQSAVELSEEFGSRYPNSKVELFMKGSAMRPSDDSPFVNEIFDPESVDPFFNQDPKTRKQQLKENKLTNYAVVRLQLLEHVYDKIYRQRFLTPDESTWALRIHTYRELTGVKELADKRMQLQLKDIKTGKAVFKDEKYDLVILATGYRRNPFFHVLKSLQPLVEKSAEGELFSVGRDYRLKFQPGKTANDAAVWLQGSCESTHGLSDSLLSILAVRSAEVVNSMLAVSGKGSKISKL
ncbi:PAK- GC kinase Sid1 [Ascosphaera pollenicola]|nr:PAK- GC kinase Sid1 [Ascosphaera pollenicola]